MPGLGRRVAFLAAIVTTSIGASAQERPVEQIQFSTTADRVLIDFIVRDKKGKPLRNLTATDVEVLEDGVPQGIESLQWVARGERGPRAAAQSEGTADAALEPKSSGGAVAPFVAILFDRLGPKTRVTAAAAAGDWVSHGATGAQVGVFLAEQGLRTLQGFTDDVVAVSQAIESVKGIAPVAQSNAEIRERLSNLRSRLHGGSPGAGPVSAEFAGPLFSGGGSRSDPQSLAISMEIRMLETALEIEEQQAGRGTLGSLLAIVNSLALRQGRKTIVLLSEGVSVPSNVEPMLVSLIAAANRANVSIYALDAAGLRTLSSNETMRREMLDLTKEMESPGDGGVMLRLLERNERILRQSAESSLGRLADQTGGRLAQGTNDLNGALRSIDEDLRGYFLLSYTPTNDKYDGRFRTVTLKVRPPHGSVQGRKGYLALRSVLPTPALAHEAPALAAMEGAGSTTRLPLRLRAFDMPGGGGLGRAVVLSEVAASDLRNEVDATGKSYREDFTVVVLIRDSAGRVLRKMSQRYEVSGPVGRLEEARRASTLFFRETDLPPGAYEVQGAVWDANANVAGVSRTSLSIAEGETSLGSLMLVRQAEPVGEQVSASADSLRFESVRVYPNMGEPVRVSLRPELAFYLTARTKGALQAEVAVACDGRERLRQPLPLPPPATDGIARFIGSLSVGALGPGACALSVSTEASTGRQTREVAFTIAP